MKALSLKTEQALGILDKNLMKDQVYHRRFQVSSALARFIEHYWYVSWDFIEAEKTLAWQPPVQAVLTHPSVHISMEQQQLRLYGVQRRVFTRELCGTSQVVGIKFKPGGFFPYTDYPMHLLTDQHSDITVLSNSALMSAVVQCSNDLAQTPAASSAIAELISRLDQQMLRYLPDIDAAVNADLQRIERLMEVVKAVPNLNVSRLSRHIGLPQRQLQRLCRKMIGVTPKWLITRSRMQWIAEQLAQGCENWREYIERFDYSDQAHFINDFKKHVGKTPRQYLRSCANPSEPHV